MKRSEETNKYPYRPPPKAPILAFAILVIGDIALALIIGSKIILRYQAAWAAGGGDPSYFTLSTGDTKYITDTLGIVCGPVFAVGLVVVFLLASRWKKNITTCHETYYTLAIETAGTWRTVLISPDAAKVSELARAVRDAIYNQKLEYSTSIHIGDNIYQHGSRNIGKISL